MIRRSSAPPSQRDWDPDYPVQENDRLANIHILKHGSFRLHPFLIRHSSSSPSPPYLPAHPLSSPSSPFALACALSLPSSSHNNKNCTKKNFKKKKKLTIVLPLIPITKSNHGSSGISRLALRSTWNPYAPFVDDWCCWLASSWRGAASSRDMKRFRAPKTDMPRGACV